MPETRQARQILIFRYTALGAIALNLLISSLHSRSVELFFTIIADL